VHVKLTDIPLLPEVVLAPDLIFCLPLTCEVDWVLLPARTITLGAASASILPKRVLTAWLIGSSAAKRLPSVET
jgi:hypothetical protein